MLKALLICTALVAPVMAAPALAQMQHTDGMDHTDGMNGGGMGGMAGMNMGDTGGMDMSGMKRMPGMNMGDAGGMDMSGMKSMPGMNMGGAGGMDMSGMEGMADILEGTAKIMRHMHEMRAMHTGGMSMGMNNRDSAPQGVGGSPLSEPGQSAFAAIAEVVGALKADPSTDWSKVNIDTLRDHLRDMDIVTIDSTTVSTEVEGGMRFDVTGTGEVTNAIRRMAGAHADMMNGVDGWTYSSGEIAGGASITVIVPQADLAKLKGLGFYGIMAAGMHHQPHHWAMATGGRPHG